MCQECAGVWHACVLGHVAPRHRHVANASSPHGCHVIATWLPHHQGGTPSGCHVIGQHWRGRSTLSQCPMFCHMTREYSPGSRNIPNSFFGDFRAYTTPFSHMGSRFWVFRWAVSNHGVGLQSWVSDIVGTFIYNFKSVVFFCLGRPQVPGDGFIVDLFLFSWLSVEGPNVCGFGLYELIFEKLTSLFCGIADHARLRPV